MKLLQQNATNQLWNYANYGNYQCKLWKYFDKRDDDTKRAKCRRCDKLLSYKSSTTNLKTHLRLKHPALFLSFTSSAAYAEEIQKKLASAEESSTGNVEIGFAVGSETNCNTITLSECSGHQDTYFIIAKDEKLPSNEPHDELLITKSYVPKVPKNLSLGHRETIEIDKCLVKFIAYDLQLFTIVDDVGFKEFVHALNPDYDLPSKNTISSSLLPASYEERRHYFMNLVNENAVSVCLTVECWSSRTMDQYMGVTAHFFSEDLEMKSVFLQCELLDGSDTGTKTARQLKTILETWGILDKVTFLVTDNVNNNMCSAIHMLNWKSFGCLERKINRVVQNALNSTNEILEKVTKIVKYLKNSSVAKETLMTHQLRNRNVEEPQTVIEAIPTRWNSTYLMLERFYSLKEDIQETVATLEVSLPIISSEEWDCIEQMCITLNPFYEVSNAMSEENYLTASSAMVLTLNLMSIYKSISLTRDFNTHVKDLQEKLKEGLTQELGDIQYCLNIAFCTLLDPRYKDVAFPDAPSLEQTKTHALTLMQNIHTDDETSSLLQPRISKVKSLVNPREKIGEKCFSIWGEFDSNITSSDVPKTAETKAREELDMFLKEKIIHRQLCPLAWWRTNKTVYPVLYKLFKSKCNIVVTSVPCKRAFSKTGFILNDRRTCLPTSKVSQVMFLNLNTI